MSSPLNSLHTDVRALVVSSKIQITSATAHWQTPNVIQLQLTFNPGDERSTEREGKWVQGWGSSERENFYFLCCAMRFYLRDKFSSREFDAFNGPVVKIAQSLPADVIKSYKCRLVLSADLFGWESDSSAGEWGRKSNVSKMVINFQCPMITTECAHKGLRY